LSSAFHLWQALAALPAPYPEAEAFASTLRSASRTQREFVVRLWLSEGVPFGFRNTPALYEEARGWIAKRLGVKPGDVTLIGSARIGFSMSPGLSFGRRFSDESDLDISVISASLFTETEECFSAWARDLEAGVVRPRNTLENRLWPENVEFGRRNIPKGFMDPNKIPFLNRYELARRVGHAMWALSVKLADTIPEHPKRKASVRVYRDSESFIRRMLINLSSTLDR
jgi:hypothetical protein